MAKKINLGKVGITTEGAYDSSKAYEKLSCVTYNYESWVSTKDVPAGNAPDNASPFWQKMSARGEQGIQGPAGPQGNSAFDGNGVEIVNNLTQGGEAAVLSAEQGKILKGELAELSAEIRMDIEGKSVVNIGEQPAGWTYAPIPKLVQGKYKFILDFSTALTQITYWTIRVNGSSTLFANRAVNVGDIQSVLEFQISADYDLFELGLYSGAVKPSLAFTIESDSSLLGDIIKDIDATNARVTEVSQDVDNLANDLTDEVNKLKDAALLLSATIVSHNKYNPSEAESGVYYRWHDGVKMERSDIASTGLIPCKANDEVYSFYGNTFYGGNVTFWDNKGNYVSGFDTTTSPWSVPDNSDIAFFRTSLYNSIINLLCININEKVEADTYREEYGYFADVPIVAPNIETLSQSIDDALKPSKMVVSHNVYNPLKAENGLYYRWSDGAKVTRSDIASTGLIPCKGGDNVYVFRYTAKYAGNVTYWDENGNYISGQDVTAGGDVATPSFTIPSNSDIAYFRTSFYNSIIDSLCININGKYDDDVFKEELAYWAELPIYAPNLNESEDEANIVKYYTMTRDSVTSIYGRNNDYGTSFIFSVIAKKNYEDAAILPRLKGTSDTSELGDNNCTTVLAYAKKHQYQHIINAGIFLVADNTADGITIMNGNILKDGVCEQFNVEQYVLGIKANGEMKSYRGMTAQQILDDGCIDAVTGFVPLFEDGVAVDNTILSICPHYNIKHPRQIIGILSTGDYFTFCCDGRTDGEEGMTLKECINTLSELASIKYAFNLDGGGSTQSVTYHKEINRRLDGRKVPNVIAFVE